MAQHRTPARPDEVASQGRRYHATAAYHCVGLPLVASVHLSAVLLKFATNEDYQAMLRGRKGLVGTNLGLDEDLMPTLQVHKSKMWPLFKEAKAVGKRAFWCATELFINGTQICSPSSV
jgi:hypothetical protein